MNQNLNRSTVAVMAQIRGTIELLARILRENGTSKIKAEVFRLGKFNNDDATDQLWKLLFELLYYVEYGSIDDVCVKAMGQLSQKEYVVYVKKEMQKRGFLSREFLALPDDMCTGSRELLLAFGWLLCKENIITRFMQTCTSPLDDDTSRLELADSNDSAKLSTQLGILSSKDPVERVNQLLWLNNKLRLGLRSLQALQRERAKLKHKIRDATYGVSASPDMNHLSMLEVYMLKHPELLKKNLQLLEKDNERLQNLLKWKDHEDIFWQWMNSVLDTKLQSLEAAAPVQVSDMASCSGHSGHSEDVPSEAMAHLEESRAQLTEAIMKYEGIVEELEQMWQTKGDKISEEELDDLLASINLEIAIQKANLTLTTQENLIHNQLVEEPRFVLVKPADKKQHRGLPAAAATKTLRNICDEIDGLQNVVDSLETELTKRQEKFQEELQRVSDTLSDVICIPPMSIQT